MSDMQELGTPVDGVGEVGQNPTTPTQDQQAGQRQPAPGAQAQDDSAKWSGNLDDLPQFREVKSKYDKTTATLQKQLEMLSQQRQADQQRQQQLEAMLEQLQTQGMDEPQKQQYELQKLQRVNQSLAQQMQQLQMENVRNRAMQSMRAKAKDFGIDVSLDELAEQPDADTAWAYVLQKGAATWTSGQKQQQQQQKSEANAPFLGGGGGGDSAQTELQGRYDKALKEFDAGKMLEILQEAANKRIELTY